MKRRIRVLLVLLAVAGSAVVGTAPAGAATPKVLKIGLSQDFDTLNPFVGQNAVSFLPWVLNWDYLLNTKPSDLSPAPGIATSWKVSPDRRTVTYSLLQNAKWSDGQPITSADVKWSLDKLGKKGILTSGYTENITSVTTPDDHTAVVHFSKPDTRAIGDLSVQILPQHIWSKVPIAKLTGSYQPTLPLVGSGPYIVTSFSRNHILKMTRNANWRGAKPTYDEIDFIQYGSADAVDRALQLGEIDLNPNEQYQSAARVGKLENVQVVSSAVGGFDELAFDICPPAICPDAKVNPAIRDRTVRQAIAYAVDRKRINQIAYRDTAVVGDAILPAYYKSFYTTPSQTYQLDVAKANQLLDQAGWKRGSGGIRTKGAQKLSFSLYARTESPSNIQAARLITEMVKPIGIQFRFQVVSTDKLTSLQTNKVNGKPAPGYDAYVWGWSGDTYDPSALLALITTADIGQGTSDSFYSNPQYDALYARQTGEFDVAKRKAIVKQMLDISQRDLPYLILVDTPNVEAYRTDRISNLPRVCPDGTGDLICLYTSYEPFLTMKPYVKGTAQAQGGGGIQTGAVTTSAAPAAATSGSTGGGGGGSSTGLIVGIVAAVAVIGAVGLVVLRRGRGDRDELEEEV